MVHRCVSGIGRLRCRAFGRQSLGLLIFAAGLGAQTPPVTPNVGLYLPPHGSYNWDTYYNSNWSLVDGLLSGLSSSTLKYVPPYTGAASRTQNGKLAELVSVKDFGATGNGTSDDTAAINAAIAAVASTSGTVVFPYGTYKTSSSITLPNRVNLIALDNGMSDAGSHTTISGSFAGFLLQISATQGNLIQGLSLVNNYWGGTQGTAGGIHYDGISAMITLRDVRVAFKDTGMLGGPAAQLISAVLENVYFSGDSGSNGLSRCISSYSRNSHILGGRTFGCHIGYDISGDDWKLDSVDSEFNDIDIRTQSLSGLLVQNSHFETSGMLWTNATTLPTTTTYPWTDNGGNGVGWSGTVRFMNNTAFFNAHGSPNPQNAPLIVLKSQPSMSGRLSLQGNDFVLGGVAISQNFNTVSASFDYTQSPALVSGLRVTSYDPVNIPTIPNDAFTQWVDQNSGLNVLGGITNKIAGGYLGANATAPAPIASTGFVDFNAGFTRVISLGANSTTLGGFQLQLLHSDGSGSVTPIVVNNSGNVALNATTIGGGASIPSSSNVHQSTTGATTATCTLSTTTYMSTVINGTTYRLALCQ